MGGSLFSNHLPTMLELLQKQAKIIVLTHQDPGTNALEFHAKYLSKKIKSDVELVTEIKDIEKALKDNPVILFKNLFSFKEETNTKQKKQKKVKFLQELSKIANIYVNDAFSLAHYSYTSTTGFPQVMSSCLGRFFEKEIEIDSHLKHPSKPCVYILGGNKPDSLIPRQEVARS